MKKSCKHLGPTVPEVRSYSFLQFRLHEPITSSFCISLVSLHSIAYNQKVLLEPTII